MINCAGLYPIKESVPVSRLLYHYGREVNSTLHFWLCLCHSVMSLIAVWSQRFGSCSGCSAGHPLWVSVGKVVCLAPLQLSEDMPVCKNGEAWWQWVGLAYSTSLLTHGLHFSSLGIILLYLCAHQE